jgi:hypothetical protein
LHATRVSPMIDASVTSDATGTDESDTMSNWNDEAPSSSGKGKKPAKDAANVPARHSSPKKASESLPDWNDGVRTATPQGGGGLWQTIRHNRVSQGLLLFLLTLAFLGGITAFVVAQLEQHKMVSMLSLAVSGYEDQAPWILPNALCESDIERIAGTGDASNPGVNAAYLRHWTPGRNVAIRSWEDLKLKLDEGLNSSQPQGPSRGILRGNHRNQILYLSLHLAVRKSDEARDQAVMLFPDSKLSDSSSWTPLSEALKLISQWRQAQDQPKDPVNVLVLLDCGKQQLNPYLAISTAGLTSAIQQTVKDLGDKNLFALVSQSDGQLNWVAPELNGSVFGYAVSQALLASQRDQITLNQFQECVTNSVAAWTKQHRGEVQRPVFLQSDSATPDFPFLAGAKEPSPRPKPVRIEQQAVSDVSRSWQKQAELRQNGLWSLSPAEFGSQTQNLLYAEKSVLMGLRPATIPDLAVPPTKSAVANVSLAMTYAAENEPSKSELSALVELVEKAFLKSRTPDPPEAEKVPVPKPNLSSWAVREWLLTKCMPDSAGPGLDQLQFADQSLTESAPGVRRTPETVEAQFLRMLAENAPWASTKDRALLRKSAGAAILCRFREEDLIAQLTPDGTTIDSRAQYGIREELLELDVRRRLAEDLIFSGRAEELTQATTTLQEISARINELATRQADVSIQLQVRDELLGGLPDLLLLYGTVAGSVPESLTPFLTADSRLLTADWTRLKTTSPTTLSDAVNSATRDAINATVSSGQPDLDAARFLTAWKSLQSAALTGTSRDQVRSYAVKYLTAQCENPEFELKWDAEEPPQDVADDASKLRGDLATSCFANLRAYLLAQLRVLDPDDEVLKELEQHSGQDAEDLRRILQHASQLAKKLRSDLQKEPRLPLVTGNTSDVAYLQLVRTEQLLRLIGPVCPEVGSPPLRRTQAPHAPVVALRRDLDRRNMLLLQAQRLLNDFWGTESVNDTNHSGGNDPWFDRRVTVLLDEAAILIASHPATEKGQTVAAEFLGENLSELLARRSAAAKEGVINIQSDKSELSLPTLSPLLTPPSPEATLEVSLAASSASTGVAEIGGRCVVFEASGDLNKLLPDAAGGSNPEGHRAMLDISSLAKNAADFKVRVPAETQLRRLQFQTYFRGHVSETQLRLADVGEEFATLLSSKPVYGVPRVTVNGDPPNLRPKVMFVLDCSASMANVDIISEETNRKQQRGEVCRTALKKTLESLVDHNFDVGLTLLGHRAYWVEKPPSSGKYEIQLTKQADLKSAAENSINPDTDVEVRFPIQRLDVELLSSIETVLDQIRESGHPKGSTTPLYLAMKTALEEMQRSEDDLAPRFLVVITDGLNGVSDDKAEAVDTKFEEVSSKLRELWSSHRGSDFSQLRCHLVYLKPSQFKKQADEDQFQALRKEFEKFQQDQRGGLFTAADSFGITKELRDSLDWIEFEIPQSAAGRKSLSSTIELPQGSTNLADMLDLKVVSRRNTLQKEQFLLEGGEHLEYTFRHRDGSLIIPEYPEVNGIKPQDSRILPRFLVKSLLPRVEPDGNVTVPISLQAVADKEGRPMMFTRRPAAFHAEIQGLNGDLELPPIEKLNDNSFRLSSLALYDRVFESSTPVPVIPLHFPKWTKAPIRANIDLWFRMSPVPDSEFDVNIPLTKALDSEYVNPTTWQEGAGKLSVKELYSEAGTEILVRLEQIEQSRYFETRVELSRAPDRVERNFFMKPVCAVVHRFHFARNNPPDKTDVHLRIMTAEKFKTLEGTLHATNPATGGPFIVDTASVE